MSKSDAPLTVPPSDLVYGASSGEGGATGDAYALPDDFQVCAAPELVFMCFYLNSPLLGPWCSTMCCTCVVS